jgi:hypothetical protein
MINENTTTNIDTDTFELDSHEVLLNAPTHERAYLFETLDGRKIINPKLRDGVRKAFNLDNKRFEGRYQTIYTALFTRKRKFYIVDNVKVSVISIDSIFKN